VCIDLNERRSKTLADQWPEAVCAENVHQFYRKDSEVRTADKPDF